MINGLKRSDVKALTFAFAATCSSFSVATRLDTDTLPDSQTEDIFKLQDETIRNLEVEIPQWSVNNNEQQYETDFSLGLPSFSENSDLTRQTATQPVAKWDRILPLYAQNVLELGFELPLPFSVSLIPNSMQQSVLMKELGVKINDFALGEQVLNLNEVDFNDPEVNSSSLQLRVAAWIFPFLELSSYVGRYHATSDLLVTIPATILGELCGKEVTPPSLNPFKPNDPIPVECDRAYTHDQFSPDIKGTNWGINMNLASSFYGFFGLLPMSYTWSKTDDGRTTGRSISISPRIGKSFQLDKIGVLTPYAGVSYMDSQLTSTDTITINAAGDTLTYSIEQENSAKYAAILGLNWNITQQYGVTLEAGYADGRKSLIGMLSYRY